jgi:acyl-CoA reductase-like NAD-dependent aldehyde dehydrogenase
LAEWCSAADAEDKQWANLPEGVRQHLIQRLRDRAISVADLNALRLWIETGPEVPEGEWYKDFGTFKICGRGAYPKTFLLRGQVAQGAAL